MTARSSVHATRRKDGAKNRGDSRGNRGERGFSYVEVVTASLLMALALVPAIDALSNAMQSARVNANSVEEHFHLVSLLEDVLAKPFSTLDTEAVSVGDPNVATAYSDAPGAARRRLVYLARYDGDNADADGNRFTGGDDGLLWVKVQLENSHRAVETLTAR